MKQRDRQFPRMSAAFLAVATLLIVGAAAWGCSSKPSTTTATTTPPSTTVATTTPPTTTAPSTTTTAPPTTTKPPTTTAPPTTTVPPTTTSSSAVTIDLVAQNLAFNMGTITVPAGAKVTVNFNNMDAAVPHNFAVYTNSSAATSIFVGSIITGPTKTTYTFTAPTTPGTYFFRCDVHPTIMTGTFVVQ